MITESEFVKNLENINNYLFDNFGLECDINGNKFIKDKLQRFGFGFCRIYMNDGFNITIKTPIGHIFKMAVIEYDKSVYLLFDYSDSGIGSKSYFMKCLNYDEFIQKICDSNSSIYHSRYGYFENYDNMDELLSDFDFDKIIDVIDFDKDILQYLFSFLKKNKCVKSTSSLE